MISPGVVVCRAEPGASRTADRLARAGYPAVIEPVLTIQPIPITDHGIQPGSHIAVSSPNAAERLSELLEHRQATLYVTGNTTADRARRAGFANVITARGNQQDLARAIAKRLPAGATLHHPANCAAGHGLANRLGHLGIAVRTLHTYRAVPVQHPGPTLAGLLSGADLTTRPVSAILIHSAAGARALARLVPPGRTVPAPVIAISQRAGDPLARVAPPEIVVARSPDEDAMIHALRSAVIPLP